MLTQWCHVNEVTLMHNNKSCPLKYHVLSANSTGIIHCKSLSGSWRMYKSMAGHQKRLWYTANVHTLTLNLLTITDPRTKYNSAENEIWQKLKFNKKCHRWDSNHGVHATCCAARQLAELPTQSSNKQQPSVEYVSDYVCTLDGYRIDYCYELYACVQKTGSV